MHLLLLLLCLFIITTTGYSIENFVSVINYRQNGIFPRDI
jgi:hypothetical protein